MIVFIGSVFSPYYVISRRAGAPDPTQHVAVNVALYGLRGPGWAMTERGAKALRTAPDRIEIGPTALHWDGAALRLDIDEFTAPLPRRLRGRITLRPATLHGTSHAIDGAGRHRWTPLAPCATAEIAFDRPDWRWAGHAYLDSNEGDRPLEEDFASWEWSRATLADGATIVLYDALRRDGTRLAFARRFLPSGGEAEFAMPPRQELPRGLWRMRRTTHGDDPAQMPRLVRALEDSPFYTRSLVATRLCGEAVNAMHESLSLDRFTQPWVQALLPFRMPR